MKSALLYGTCTGKTEAAAELIRDEFGDDFFDTYEDIAQLEPGDLAQYDFIVCGVPTWDVGEIQYDWQDIYDELDNVDLGNTKIAFFGMGDQGGYPDTFQDAIGMVYLKMLERGRRGRSASPRPTPSTSPRARASSTASSAGCASTTTASRS